MATRLNAPRRLQLSVKTGPVMVSPSGKWWRKLKWASTPSTLAPSVTKPRGRASCGCLALWFLHENGSRWYWPYIPLLQSQKSPSSEHRRNGKIRSSPWETLLACNKWIHLCNPPKKKSSEISKVQWLLKEKEIDYRKEITWELLSKNNLCFLRRKKKIHLMPGRKRWDPRNLHSLKDSWVILN